MIAALLALAAFGVVVALSLLGTGEQADDRDVLREIGKYERWPA